MEIKEHRLIFKHIDEPGYANDIGCYLEHGGYEQLKKALSMEPEAICAEVLESGVRGRGGAGFPAGMKWKFLDRKSGKPIYLICNCDDFRTSRAAPILESPWRHPQAARAC